MGVFKKDFGCTAIGQQATLYTIENDSGIAVSVSDYGATIVAIELAGKDSVVRDIVLGYNDVSEYENGQSYYGATIGRCANIIKDAEIMIKGKRYILPQFFPDAMHHPGFESPILRANEEFKKRITYEFEIVDTK